jgi:hypothetical protein
LERGTANGAVNDRSFLKADGSPNVVYKPFGTVRVKISDREDIAIEDTDIAGRQPRVIFTTEENIRISNEKLAARQSRYRLMKDGDGNQFVLLGGRKLYQVVASSARNPNVAVASVPSNCDDMGGAVMGCGQHLERTPSVGLQHWCAGLQYGMAAAMRFSSIPQWTMLQDPGYRLAIWVSTFLFTSDAARATRAAGSEFSAEIRKVSGNSAGEQMARLGDIFGPVGRRWGTVMRNAASRGNMTELGKTLTGSALSLQFDRLCKDIGINRYAAPDIGQAFQTVSLGKMEEYAGLGGVKWKKMEDFTSPRFGDQHVYKDPVSEFHWGGVVVNSGQVRVTFENYARAVLEDLGVRREGNEGRFFFQMCYVPDGPPGENQEPSWHEKRARQANPLTMAVRRIEHSRCTIM